MFEAGATPDDGSGWAVPGVERCRPTVLSAEVLALRAAIDAVAAQDLDALDGRQALAEVKALLAEVQRLDVVGLSRLGHVDRLHLHELDGARSTARWVEAQGVGASGTQVAVARRLGQFPLVAAQVLERRLPLSVAQKLQAVLVRLRPYVDRADGLIDGQPAAEVLGGVVLDGVRLVVAQARGGFPTLDDPVLQQLSVELPEIAARPTSDLARLEAAFLVVAAHVEPGQIAACLGVLVDALLPIHFEDRARRRHESRGVRLVRRADGVGWRLDGDLDLECGERFYAFLQSELARDPGNPLDTEVAGALREQGLDPYDPELGSYLTPRSTAERTHDALSNGLARHLASDLGGTHDKNPVQVVVTVPAASLDAQPGALPARAASGATLPCSLVRRWACGGSLTRHVLDLRGRVVQTSHSERTLKAHERRALDSQTGGHCQGAGGRRSRHDPGAVLHPHHATPWATCRRTSLADTVQLCDSCHHHVHHGQRALRLKDGRRLGPHGWLE